MNPIQIDKEQFKKWISIYLDTLRNVETELLVYRSIVEVLNRHLGEEIGKLEQLMRESPEMKQTIDQKYTELKARAMESIDKGAQDQALALFLQQWKPSGPTH